jgi:lauroyl/myristoyl acyltransferase
MKLKFENLMKTLLRSGEISFILIFFPPSPYVAQEKLEKQVIKMVWPNSSTCEIITENITRCMPHWSTKE